MALVQWACSEKVELLPAPMPKQPSAVDPPAQKRLVWRDAAAEGPLPAQVQQAAQEAQERGQRLLVYVGASWCEPCRYFHDAARQGQLDGELAQVMVLAYDADRDRARLEAAGYQSKMIPLLAIPTAGGLNSGKMLQGSVKGPGAVGDLVPRVQRLLGP